MSKFNDVFQALEEAIRMENASYNYYLSFSEEAGDAEVKALFRQIAGDEEAHKEILTAELQALKETQPEQTKRPSYWMQLIQKDSDSELPREVDSEGIQTYLLLCRRVNKMLKEANDELVLNQIRQEQELAIASEIQNSLLPKELPQETGMEISAINIMARSVGGDYYDCVVNPSGQLAFVIADVMGKGIPAALIMTTVQAVWRSNVMMDLRTPDETLSSLNQAVYSNFSSTGRFVTIFSALYDPNTSTLKYGNSGHNPPLYLPYNSDKFEELDTDGTLIGIIPDSKYYTAECILNEGDLIVIYTDGIVEAEREEEALFGTERLKELIIQNRFCDVKEIQDKIISAVKEYTQDESKSDDITLMVLKVTI
ncbi:SpoIIE family protein phosphatase [bacterium]|nr:SpoIIE family protein phosphatase [bacterium]